LDRDQLATHCPVTGTSESALAIALYVYARCCSLLKLAHREKLIAISADWHIDPANWLQYGRENQQRAGSIGIFDRPVERQLIQSLMAVVDAIYGDGLSSSLPTSTANSSSNRSPRGTPNWSKLTINLAQSWLAFHRDCRIFGDTKLQNPHLAIARCGLTAIVCRYLQILLESLGVSAVEEL
jgi:hypothetical protein